jgi:dTDP-4-amino-4,6-dideoxygalactose transaminase
MQVPFFDLAEYHAALLPEAERVFRRVFSSGRAILGEEVRAFEAELRCYLEAPHVVGVSSGTDALVVALSALGVTRGDRILTTPLSFFATAEAIARLGAIPVFCDVDISTYNWSLKSLELAPRDVCGALLVHLFGRICPLAPVKQSVRDGFVVEDAAQAFGARSDGHAAGTLADAGCYSFFPSKPLGALGDAGAIVTSTAALAERCFALRSHDAQAKYVHASARGGNYRLDELQAGLLRLKLKGSEQRRQKRCEIAETYRASLTDVGELVVPSAALGDAWSVYAPRVLERRDELQEFLKAAGVGSAVYYPCPIHLQPAFRDLGYAPGDFPVAERLSRELLALPIYPELGAAEQQWVIECVRRFFGRN